MKDTVIRILLLILFAEVIYLAVPKKESKVLSESITQTPTVTPTPVPTPTPTPVPTLKPTPVPTPTPIPQPKYTSEEINGFINRFAGQYGVDPNVLRHIAICESGFNPQASNAGYAGLFQFGTTTWTNIRKEIGEDTDPNLRFNAEEATQTAAYALAKGKASIWPNCTP
ncbi:MAG TPA: transglycosylase SLT domain-containing protein [Patescibacteria group bacterium]|nr:transglycosylase SLT domain-containing protein [Patescibacteria group bacterium]